MPHAEFEVEFAAGKWLMLFAVKSNKATVDDGALLMLLSVLLLLPYGAAGRLRGGGARVRRVRCAR